jgi:DNA invertase Pin-like site-specific DNA recombinase
VIAQEEREMIAARTKAALAASKARGVTLGGWRGGPKVDAYRGGAAVQKAADAFAQRIGAIAGEMRRAGLSLAQIAAELQTKGVMTARGGAWTATTVRNVVGRKNIVPAQEI